MSPYLPLNLKWRFISKEGRAQFKSLFYRIYINIFGIFLRIPILPMGIDKDSLSLYYKGDDIFWIWPWRRWYFIKQYNNHKKFMSLTSLGSFDTLKEIDDFWKEYYEACYKSYLKDFKNNPEFKYLKIGDKFENGDEYSDGTTLFIIGGKETGLTSFDNVTKDVICYNPRRNIHKIK